jgi:hypothetical protein
VRLVDVGISQALSGCSLITHTNGRPIVLRNPTKEGLIAERLGNQVDAVTGKIINPFFGHCGLPGLAQSVHDLTHGAFVNRLPGLVC